MDYKIFFSIIRSGIWQRDMDVEVPDGYDWEPVIGLLRSHFLVGLTANAIKRLPAGKCPSDQDVLDKLTMTVFRHVMMREKLQETICVIFDEVEKIGVEPILLKGESLVDFYPKECQRAVGDIDMLVTPKEYKRTVEVLQHLSGDLGHEDAMERHYKVEYNGITVEIHQHPGWNSNGAYKAEYQKLSERYLAHDSCEYVELNGKRIRVLPLQYNLIYVFNHFVEHLRDGGIGLKQIIDWVMMIDYVGKEPRRIDLERLNLDLKKIGLFRAWKVMGGIAVKNLGLTKEYFPFYDEKLAMMSQEGILERIMTGGDFGQNIRGGEGKKRFAPVRIWHNCMYMLREGRFLWTLFPFGAIASCWGLVKSSLLAHLGVSKKNKVFN